MQMLGSMHDVARIKLGPGVVGNTSTIAIAAVVAAAAIACALAWAGMADHIVVVLLIVFSFASVVCIGNWIFASIYPDLAVLGGGEFLALRQAQMAGKDVGEIPTIKPIEAPPPPIVDGKHSGS